MTISLIEKMKLVQRGADIKEAVGSASPLQKMKMMQELSDILEKLGGSVARKASEAVSEDLPELVRKLRDGELKNAAAELLADAIKAAEGLLGIQECIDRAKEWLNSNPALVRN